MADGSPRPVRLQLQSRSSTFSEAAIRVIRSLSLRPSVVSPVEHSTDEEQPDADDAANHRYNLDATEGDDAEEDDRYSAPTLEDNEEAECWVTELPPVYLGMRPAIVLVEQPGLKRAVWLGVEEHTARLMGLALKPAVSVPAAQRVEEQRMRQEQRAAETARLIQAAQYLSATLSPRKHVFCTLTTLDLCHWVAAIIMICVPHSAQDTIPTIVKGGVTLSLWLHLADVKVQLAVLNLVVDGLALITSTAPPRPLILSLVIFLLLVSGVVVSLDCVSLFILWRAIQIAVGIWLRVAVTQYQVLIGPPHAAAEQEQYSFFRVLGQAYQVTIGFWSLLLCCNVGTAHSVHAGRSSNSNADLSTQTAAAASNNTQLVVSAADEVEPGGQAGAHTSLTIANLTHASNSGVASVPPLYWNPIHSNDLSLGNAAAGFLPTVITSPQTDRTTVAPVVGASRPMNAATLAAGIGGVQQLGPQIQLQLQPQVQPHLQPQSQLPYTATVGLLPAMQQQLIMLQRRVAMRDTVSQNGTALEPAGAADVQLVMQRSQSYQQDGAAQSRVGGGTPGTTGQGASEAQQQPSSSNGHVCGQAARPPSSNSFLWRFGANSPSKATPFRHVQQQQHQPQEHHRHHHHQPPPQQQQQQGHEHGQMQRQAVQVPEDRASNMTTRQQLILAGIEVQALALKQRTQAQTAAAVQGQLAASTKPAGLVLPGFGASATNISTVTLQPEAGQTRLALTACAACTSPRPLGNSQETMGNYQETIDSSQPGTSQLKAGQTLDAGESQRLQSVDSGQLHKDLNAAATAAQQLLDQLLLKQ